MSAYDELVERCRREGSIRIRYDHIEYVLAEVLRTLETVTPEMARAMNRHFDSSAEPTVLQDDKGIVVLGARDLLRYFATLRASPLSPP